MTMTEGNITKHLLKFALPLMGGLLLQMLYNTVDGIVVGNFVGDAALGAVNTSGSFGGLFLHIASGLAAGAGVFLAQLYGAKQKEKLQRAMSTLFLMMVGVGLFFTAIAELLTIPVLTHILKVPADAFGYAEQYLRIYLAGLVLQFIYNALAAALRSIGDSKATMYFLIISSIVNIILDLIFVVGLKLDVIGVAVATVIAQAVSVVISLIYLNRKQPLLAVNFKHLVFLMEDCIVFLKVGIPASFQSLVSGMGVICVQRLVNSYGSSFMAGMAAATKIDQFAVVPIMSVAQAMIVFSGQNVGANDHRRAQEGLKYAWRISLSGVVVLTVIFLTCARPMIMLFGCRGETLQYGVDYLLFVPVTLFFAALMFPSRCMLQGAGDVSATMVFTFVTLGVRVASAYALAATPVGYRAVFVANAVDFGVGTILNIIRLRSGKWKTKSLIAEPDQKAKN